MEQSNKAIKNGENKDKYEGNFPKSLNNYSQCGGDLSKLQKKDLGAILYCKYYKLISDTKGKINSSWDSKVQYLRDLNHWMWFVILIYLDVCFNSNNQLLDTPED